MNLFVWYTNYQKGIFMTFLHVNRYANQEILVVTLPAEPEEALFSMPRTI